MKQTLVTIALASSLVACTTTQPTIVEPTADAATIADYWKCDNATKTSMLSLGDAINCSVTYEKLLKSFPGPEDSKFQKFLAWWKANKT